MLLKGCARCTAYRGTRSRVAVEGYDRFVNLVSLLGPKQKIKVLALDHRTGNVGYVEATVR